MSRVAQLIGFDDAARQRMRLDSFEVKRTVIFLVFVVLFLAALGVILSGKPKHDPKDLSYWVRAGGDRDWSGAAARNDPEAEFFLGLSLIRTNLTKFVARVPLLSKVPVVGKRFENTSYTIDGSIGPEQLENAYEWIKKSADQGFAPAEESEKLFTGRIPVPNQSGPRSRGQPFRSKTNGTSSAADSHP